MVSKRGTELPMNVIVIAVIALIVLILVVSFLMGGTTILFEKIAGVFRGGYDERSFVLQTCETRCKIAQDLPEASWVGSSYCKGFFYMDNTGDGKVDLMLNGADKIKYYCWGYDNNDRAKVLGAPPCPGVQEKCGI